MISLSTLEINVVKKYLSHENQESAKRKLHRRFSKTIENCGGTLDCLREGNANITFPDEEAEFIKLILIQLVKEEGLSNKIWQNKDGVFSLDDIHQFIQDDIDYLEECGYDEATIKGVVKELDMLFQLSTRVKLEECHRILDCYALNIQPYLYTYQLKILEDLRQNLVREMVKSSVNAAIYCGEFGECIKDAMELSEAENMNMSSEIKR
jgi:hypothetical protein